jgi:hypothetical protein
MLGPNGRLARCNVWRAMQTPPQAALDEPTADEVAAAGCMVMPYLIKEKWGKVLKMLKVSFGKVDAGCDMIAAAAGSGRDFINAAMAKGRAANCQDKAAVMARYQRVIRQAVPGELRLEPFNAFIKGYRRVNRDVAPTSRQSAEAEIEMINLIAYKDDGISELYEVAMTAAIAESIYDTSTALSVDGAIDSELLPISDWTPVTVSKPNWRAGKRLPGGSRMIEVEVALDDDGGSLPSTTHALLAAIGYALRADSPDAPDTHAEAMRRGAIWVQAEAKELANHAKNVSWVTISRDQLPRGRRVHKTI